MRSYLKVYYKQGGPPAFVDSFYGSLGEVPGNVADAILAFDRLTKQQYIFELNRTYQLYVSLWGFGPDTVPQWVFDNGGGAFQLGSILQSNFGPYSPGTVFPFTDYKTHPKN